MKALIPRDKWIDQPLQGGGGGYDSILEVGSASGLNLSLYNVKRRFGIEPSKFNCELAKKNYNIDMFNGMWEEYLSTNPNETFDLVFLSHIVEHVVNPMKFVRECSFVCNRYMFIEVPCLEILFEDEPYGIFTDEHVNYFTTQSLWNLMNKLGFRPINFEIFFGLHTYGSSSFSSILTLWEKDNINLTENMIHKAKDLLHKYIDVSEKNCKRVADKIEKLPNNERIALWGTGNHLAKMLGYTNLSKKNIVKVYDSDELKHGKKMLGIPITPFNKQDVISGEVESILITTFASQNIILKIINEMNLSCKVYTLYDN